jgi:hypothetical protein
VITTYAHISREDAKFIQHAFTLPNGGIALSVPVNGTLLLTWDDPTDARAWLTQMLAECDRLDHAPA